MPFDFATAAQVRTLIANGDPGQQASDMQEVADLLAASPPAALGYVASETLQRLSVADRTDLFPLLANALTGPQLLAVFRGMDDTNVLDRIEIAQAVERFAPTDVKARFRSDLTLDERASSRQGATSEDFSDPIAKARAQRNYLLSEYGDKNASLADNTYRVGQMRSNTLESFSGGLKARHGDPNSSINTAKILAQPYTDAFHRDWGARATHTVKENGALADWVSEVLAYRPQDEDSPHAFADSKPLGSLKQQVADITARIKEAEADGRERLHVVAVPVANTDPLKGLIETARFDVYKEVWAGDGEVTWRLDRVLDHQGVQTFDSVEDLRTYSNARRGTQLVMPRVDERSAMHADREGHVPLIAGKANLVAPDAAGSWAEAGLSAAFGVGGLITLGGATTSASLLGLALAPELVVAGGIVAAGAGLALGAVQGKKVWDHLAHDASFVPSKNQVAFDDALSLGTTLAGAATSGLLGAAAPAKAALGWGAKAAEGAETLVQVAQGQSRLGAFMLSSPTTFAQAGAFAASVGHGAHRLHKDWDDLTPEERTAQGVSLVANIGMAALSHKISVQGNMSVELPLVTKPAVPSQPATATTPAVAAQPPKPLTQEHEANIWRLGDTLAVGYGLFVGAANAYLTSKGLLPSDPNAIGAISTLCYVFRGGAAYVRTEWAADIGRQIGELDSAITAMKNLRDEFVNTTDPARLNALRKEAHWANAEINERLVKVEELTAGKRALAAGMGEDDRLANASMVARIREHAKAAFDAVTDKAILTGVAPEDRMVNAWSLAKLRENAMNTVRAMEDSFIERTTDHFFSDAQGVPYSPTNDLALAGTHGKPLPPFMPADTVHSVNQKLEANPLKRILDLTPDLTLPQVKTAGNNPGKLLTLKSFTGQVHDFGQVTTLAYNFSNTANYIDMVGLHWNDPSLLQGLGFAVPNAVKYRQLIATRVAQRDADRLEALNPGDGKIFMGQFQLSSRAKQTGKTVMDGWNRAGWILEGMDFLRTMTGVDHPVVGLAKMLSTGLFIKGTKRLAAQEASRVDGLPVDPIEVREGTKQLGAGVMERMGISTAQALYKLATASGVAYIATDHKEKDKKEAR